MLPVPKGHILKMKALKVLAVKFGQASAAACIRGCKYHCHHLCYNWNDSVDNLTHIIGLELYACSADMFPLCCGTAWDMILRLQGQQMQTWQLSATLGHTLLAHV